MAELKTIKLTPAEYELLLYALDTAIDHLEEYNYKKETLDVTWLKEAIKSC